MGDRWTHRQTDRQKNRSLVIQAPNQLALSQKFISPIFINFLLGANLLGDDRLGRKTSGISGTNFYASVEKVMSRSRVHSALSGV